jgi:hypothetical protein
MQKKLTVYSTPFITVDYYPEDKLVYHTIHKPMGMDELVMLQEALTAGADTLIKHGGTKWLSDDSRNGPTPIEILEWGNIHWSPRLIKNGWKYWATVVPDELHAAATMAPIIDELFTRGIRMNVFTDVQKALDWLNSRD